MAESLNRKACDRCHAQKLSCKRIGDGICDRCLRLKAECKSSPSLRYKKQIQHYDQTQEQQQQQHHHHQQPERPQLLMQHHQPRELQQPQQQPPPPRLDYSQGQSAMAQITLNHETHQHIQARGSTERRSPKRRRTGSEAHLVQRDAGLPQSANDATTNPGLQGHLMAVPNPAMGLAEYAINLRNMDYMAALAQPSMPPHHLLGSQIPSRVDDCFTLHQVIPSLWPYQSHEEAQQLQQHHHQLGPHHHLHHQQQQVFDQVSVAPLVVPDPAASQQQQIFSSVPQEQHQYQHQQQQLLHQQRATTTLLGCRRRQGAPPPVLTHATASSVIDRRPRSNKVRINYTDFVAPKQDNLSGPYIMDQFFQIYARVRVLSNHLECLEQSIDYSDGPDGQPNEFTVAELYKHTHEVVDILERVVAVKNAPRATATSAAAAAVADCPLDAADAANGMFTLSLYARLLDLLQRLFAHVRARLARADPKRDDTFPSWLLPEMNIGAASIGAHPVFHMSLTVQLAMQFLSRFREVTVVLGLVDAAATNGNGTHGASGRRAEPAGDAAGISLSFVDIKNREGMLSKTLGQLQDELNTFMDTMDAIDAMEEEEDKK